MADTIELIRAAKHGDEYAFEKLIGENSALIWSIVRRFLGRGTDSDDLYQLGCVGLLKAIRGFDESLGNRFSTYAVPKIAGEIRRFLRDDGAIKVSRTIKERASKIRYAASFFQTKHGRAPTLSEISEETGFSPEEIAQAEGAVSYTESLNREINDDGQTLEEMLPSHGIEENILDYVSLSDAIKLLPDRERIVIMLRYFKSMTQEQTARIMGISQVQVSRIERAAIARLREKM